MASQQCECVDAYVNVLIERMSSYRSDIWTPSAMCVSPGDFATLPVLKTSYGKFGTESDAGCYCRAYRCVCLFPLPLFECGFHFSPQLTPFRWWRTLYRFFPLPREADDKRNQFYSHWTLAPGTPEMRRYVEDSRSCFRSWDVYCIYSNNRPGVYFNSRFHQWAFIWGLPINRGGRLLLFISFIHNQIF